MINKVMATLMVTLVFGFRTPAGANDLPVDDLPQEREVLFSRDVAPVLKKNCVACHNASNEEGGVNLESAAKIKSSDSGAVLVPGKPEASLLFLLASHAEEPVMPPEDNDVSASALNPMELALLRGWIESGARVDPVPQAATEREWQTLPPTLQTVYGSAMTADGRLSAVSFGNQIRVFGAKSARPMGTLQLDAADQTKPAHDDFVQDLFLDPTGRRLVSAGFRNVKLWEMAPFESTSVPQFNYEDVLAIAMNASGSHLAVLSRRGELSVAAIGKDRWQWMKGFDMPDEFGGDHPAKVPLAVGAAGHEVAIGSGNTIRIVRIDGIETETINTTDAITSLLWLGKDHLVTADATGHVLFWKRDGATWATKKFDVFDQAVLGIYCGTQEPKRLVAIDVSGNVANWNETNNSFDTVGKLPSPAVTASLSSTGTTLWMTTTAGVLAQYRIADKTFAEVAKLDPVAVAQWATDNWQTLVGERLVEAHDKDVKQAEANVTAEKKSVETLIKEIETKTKLRDEKQSSVLEAKKAAETAATKFAEAKAVEKTSNEQRTELTGSVKQLGVKIAEVERQLAELKQEHTDSEKRLALIPDTQQLADAVKASAEASSKADQAVATKKNELLNATASLRLAHETKVRGEARLKGLNVELQTQQQVLGQVKADQETRKAKQAASESLRDQSRAADQTLAVMASGNRIVTRATNLNSETSGAWSLWSGAGDWLTELSGLPAGGQLVATGDDCVLIKATDGTTLALRISPRLWQHRTTIGSSTGQSPFADRVLSVDVDSEGNYLATGGGEPSRGGELMIWKVPDGSLIRAIENPHEDTVMCVRFSPDGTMLATGSADRMLKLWDVGSGKLIKTLEGHTHHVTSIAWNFNGRQLASGSADATVKIWDLDSGQNTRTISGLKTEVTGLVFVGREDRIGIVGGDGYFRVHRTDNGARQTNAKILGGYLYALDSNRDGSQFFVGGVDGAAVVVDQSGKQLVKYTSETE